eukprot:scaffold95131_cov14-Tisochrysis_lutea.AAC.2
MFAKLSFFPTQKQYLPFPLCCRRCLLPAGQSECSQPIPSRCSAASGLVKKEKKRLRQVQLRALRKGPQTSKLAGLDA